MKTDNELIAKFMGLSTQDVDYDLSQIRVFKDGIWRKAEYHTSWDWLMPVVEKIAKTSIREGRYGNVVDFSIIFNDAPDFDSVGWIFWAKNSPGDQNQVQSYPQNGTLIERVYKAVIEFIKWYNQQSK